MRKPTLIALSLTCALGLSGCAGNGSRVPPPPVCPVLPSLPPELMQEPTIEQDLQRLLFDPVPSAPSRCADSSDC